MILDVMSAPSIGPTLTTAGSFLMVNKNARLFQLSQLHEPFTDLLIPSVESGLMFSGLSLPRRAAFLLCQMSWS